PGKTPRQNAQFLLFLAAFLKGIDEYQDFLRCTVASAGNDHRLGANEAPPAVISIFVGDELDVVLKALATDGTVEETGKTRMGMGALVLPHIMKDTTDRNRTSPFAFTGNKFEFRMPGSSLSVADPNIVLNTAVAESLDHIYEALKDVPAEGFDEAVHALLKQTLSDHQKVLFNGNGYTDEWIEEAERRGLYNLKSLPECAPRLLAEKNIDLFVKHGVFTEEEIKARYEIMIENYSKAIHIESLTMQEMVRKDLTGALIDYMNDLGGEAAAKKKLLGDDSSVYEQELLQKLDKLAKRIGHSLQKLSDDTDEAESEDGLKSAEYYHDVILADMEKLRASADEAEKYIPEKYLPYPTYDELLFSLR
ncbi:MAG: glutamine synthetase type III, partial [Eubacterium sp.]|nr:glutamine synthetase type III [Eubacterium sp.]